MSKPVPWDPTGGRVPAVVDDEKTAVEDSGKKGLQEVIEMDEETARYAAFLECLGEAVGDDTEAFVLPVEKFRQGVKR